MARKLTDEGNLKYDPAEFIVPAQDARGHSEREWCRVSPGHDRQLDIVVNSRAFPYRTKGDVIRHAIVRHLKWLEAVEEMPSVTGQVDMMMEVLRDEQFQQEMITVFEALARTVGGHVAGGAHGEAKRLIAKMKMHVAKMPDGHWKERYAERLDSEFGYLLEPNRAASLSGGGSSKSNGKATGATH